MLRHHRLITLTGIGYTFINAVTCLAGGSLFLLMVLLTVTGLILPWYAEHGAEGQGRQHRLPRHQMRNASRLRPGYSHALGSGLINCQKCKKFLLSA